MSSTRYWHEEKFSERKVSEINSKKYRDKEWLFQQYSILRKKVKDIADDCGTSRDVIYDWLKKYNIKANRYTEKPDKEILENLYIKEFVIFFYSHKAILLLCTIGKISCLSRFTPRYQEVRCGVSNMLSEYE